MKQVCVNRATWACTASTTRGAAFPTDVTAIPDPKSMSWLPSASTTIPPPARSTYTGKVVPTPEATATLLRSCNATERGPGIAVFSTRCCGTDIALTPRMDGWWAPISPARSGPTSARTTGSRPDYGDDVPLGDDVANANGDLGDRPTDVGEYWNLHLHRVEKHEHVQGTDLITDAHEHLDHIGDQFGGDDVTHIGKAKPHRGSSASRLDAPRLAIAIASTADSIARDSDPDVVHDVLDAGVVLETVEREVLAISRVLEPAVRHLGDDRDVGVDPYAAEVQSAAHPHRATVILRPHRGRETVLDVIGPAHRFVLIGEGLHRDHGAENLVLDEVVGLPHLADDRGREEIARVALARAAGQQLRVVGKITQHAAHPLELDGVVERTVEDVLVRSAGLGVSCLLGQRIGEVVGNSRGDQHAGGCRAVLTGVEVAGDRDVLGRVLEVGIIEDDHRRLAAKLQVRALEVLGRGRE